MTEITWEDEPGQAELVVRQIVAAVERVGEARCELRNRRRTGA